MALFKDPWFRLAAIVPLLLASVPAAVAGGPSDVLNGWPVTWPDSAMPIGYRTDPGLLGPFSNKEALQLVDLAFHTWQEASGGGIRFERTGDLSADIQSISQFNQLTRAAAEGGNPVIFDNDGSIVRALFGKGAEGVILGLAGPSVFRNGEIIGAYALFNGAFLVEYPSQAGSLFSTMLHEIGHFCGLDHSQIHSHLANDGVGANDVLIPIMYPLSTDDESIRTRLTRDDAWTVSNLYPGARPPAKAGTLAGAVFRGGYEVPGVNVVARRIVDGRPSMEDAYSAVTGTFEYGYGTYEFPNLPGGEYELYIEPVDPRFFGASSVGRYATSKNDRSFRDPVPSHFYNGGEGDMGRAGAAAVTLRDGDSLDSVEFILPEGAAAKEDESFTQPLGIPSTIIGGAAPDTAVSESQYQYLLAPGGGEGRIYLSAVSNSPGSRRFDIVVKRGGRVEASDPPSASSGADGAAVVVLGRGGDLPLAEDRYFIAVRNRSNRDLEFTLAADLVPPETGDPEPTTTPTPRPEPTARPAPPTPTPTARLVNPSLGLVAFDEIAGVYPNGMAVHNFDVGLSDASGRLRVRGRYDGLPDPETFATLLFLGGVVYPAAKDFEFSGETDPRGNGSEGVYYLNGGSIRDLPPVTAKLGATGGFRRGGIDINGNPLDDVYIGPHRGDIVPALPAHNGSQLDLPLVDLEPAGNGGFYVLDRNGKIYAEGTADSEFERLTPPPGFGNAEAVGFAIYRGRRIELDNSAFGGDLTGTGAYILDARGRVYAVGDAPELDTAGVAAGAGFQYRDIELFPHFTGTVWAGVGLLNGDGSIRYAPFEGVPYAVTDRQMEFAAAMNPFDSELGGFNFDIARDFEFEISDQPVYGLDEAGRTSGSAGRRVGLFLLDGFGGLHTAGDSTRFIPLFGAQGGDIREIGGLPAAVAPISMPYFGGDVVKDLEISPPVDESFRN